MSKEFLKKRISVFAGKEIDPDADEQVQTLLNHKFNIKLPQRVSLNESLKSCISDHEIITLLIQYRTDAA